MQDKRDGDVTQCENKSCAYMIVENVTVRIEDWSSRSSYRNVWNDLCEDCRFTKKRRMRMQSRENQRYKIENTPNLIKKST